MQSLLLPFPVIKLQNYFGKSWGGWLHWNPGFRGIHNPRYAPSSEPTPASRWCMFHVSSDIWMSNLDVEETQFNRYISIFPVYVASSKRRERSLKVNIGTQVHCELIVSYLENMFSLSNFHPNKIRVTVNILSLQHQNWANFLSRCPLKQQTI